MIDLNKYIVLILCVTTLATPSLLSAKTLTVTAKEYGEEWSFTVSQGNLECKMNAVVMHTNQGTYSINGKAMGLYEGKYGTWRDIAKPYPRLNDSKAKMPPPADIIRKGLALCND